MDEAEALARLALDQQIRQTLERVDRVLAETRSREVPQETWQGPPVEPPAPAPEPPRPVRRAAMAPPAPSKIVRPQHDASGRIVSAATYEGEQAQALGVWEQWVRREIRRQIDQRAETLCEGIGEAMGQMAQEERAQIDARIDALQEQVDMLAKALDLLRAPPTGPRLVDAAD